MPQEISLGLHREDNEGRGRESSLKTHSGKTDGFEPFVNPLDPKQGNQENGQLFVNNYGGNYAQKMALNRSGVERALRIAHLDGQVYLTSLAPSRDRSSEAQGNELAGKRFLFFGEKIEDKENPMYRVVSIPQGWRIEINDTRITEELIEKKLTGEKRQRVFIGRFRSQLREALKECVWREKLSGIKDESFTPKLHITFISPLVVAAYSPILVLATSPSFYIPTTVLTVFLGYGLANVPLKENIRYRERKTDSMWEYFMPPVEIDKVARTYTYLAGKGRRLVRETKE